MINIKLKYMILNNSTQNPLEYIIDVFQKNIISEEGRKIIFSPAHLFTKKENVGSHEEVVSYFINKNWDFKCIETQGEPKISSRYINGICSFNYPWW